MGLAVASGRPSSRGGHAGQLCCGTSDYLGYRAPLAGIPVEAEQAELLLEVSLRLKKTELWAEAGHEVAWAQLPVQMFPPAGSPPLQLGQECRS